MELPTYRKGKQGEPTGRQTTVKVKTTAAGKILEEPLEDHASEERIRRLRRRGAVKNRCRN